MGVLVSHSKTKECLCDSSRVKLRGYCVIMLICTHAILKNVGCDGLRLRSFVDMV